MPCEYQTYPDDNIIVKRFRGRITTRCVLDLLDRVEQDLSYVEGMMELADLRLVTEMAIPRADVKKFADLITGMDRRQRQPSRKAVIATSQDILDAARFYVDDVRGKRDLQIGVFSDIDEGLAFLGLPGRPLGADLARASMRLVDAGAAAPR
ncbi:hypothetical protein [Roseivivax sp. CAU 1753]